MARKVNFQKRHFEFIASTIKDWRQLPGAPVDQQRDYLALCFADACEATNPNFDRLRFLKAGGVEDFDRLPMLKAYGVGA